MIDREDFKLATRTGRRDNHILRAIQSVHKGTTIQIIAKHGTLHVPTEALSTYLEHDIADNHDQQMALFSVLRKSGKTVKYYKSPARSKRNKLYYITAEVVHGTQLGHIRHSMSTYCTLTKGDPRRAQNVAHISEFSELLIAKTKIYRSLHTWRLSNKNRQSPYSTKTIRDIAVQNWTASQKLKQATTEQLQTAYITTRTA